MDKKDGDGDCYVVAANLVVDNKLTKRFKSPVLVHGVPLGRGAIKGERFGHAWVEDGDEVFDYSNGLNIQLPKELYYAVGNIEEAHTIKYTRDRTIKRLLSHGNYGPWEEVTMNTGGYPDGMTQADHDEAHDKDCPEDSGFENETCQECNRFHACSTDWPHPCDCKCRACLEEGLDSED